MGRCEYLRTVAFGIPVAASSSDHGVQSGQGESQIIISALPMLKELIAVYCARSGRCLCRLAAHRGSVTGPCKRHWPATVPALAVGRELPATGACSHVANS